MRARVRRTLPGGGGPEGGGGPDGGGGPVRNASQTYARESDPKNDLFRPPLKRKTKATKQKLWPGCGRWCVAQEHCTALGYRAGDRPEVVRQGERPEGAQQTPQMARPAADLHANPPTHRKEDKNKGDTQEPSKTWADTRELSHVCAPVPGGGPAGGGGDPAADVGEAAGAPARIRAKSERVVISFLNLKSRNKRKMTQIVRTQRQAQNARTNGPDLELNCTMLKETGAKAEGPPP